MRELKTRKTVNLSSQSQPQFQLQSQSHPQPQSSTSTTPSIPSDATLIVNRLKRSRDNAENMESNECLQLDISPDIDQPISRLQKNLFLNLGKKNDILDKLKLAVFEGVYNEVYDIIKIYGSCINFFPIENFIEISLRLGHDEICQLFVQKFYNNTLRKRFNLMFRYLALWTTNHQQLGRLLFLFSIPYGHIEYDIMVNTAKATLVVYDTVFNEVTEEYETKAINYDGYRQATISILKYFNIDKETFVQSMMGKMGQNYKDNITYIAEKM